MQHTGKATAYQLSTAVDVDARPSNVHLDGSLLCEQLAECLARRHPAQHGLEGAFTETNGADAVVDAARPQATLGDGETLSLADQQVCCGHAHVVQLHLLTSDRTRAVVRVLTHVNTSVCVCYKHAYLGVANRGIIIAEHSERPHQRDSGCVHGNQNHRLLGAGISIEARFPHCDRAQRGIRSA